MAKPEVRKKYLEGLKSRKVDFTEEVRSKKSESMKKTLAARREDTPGYIEEKSRKQKEHWQRIYSGEIPMPVTGKNLGKSIDKLKGDLNPAKREDVRAKISIKAKEREAKKKLLRAGVI
jgi:hypothetical protein